MRLKLIGCEVLYRELCAAVSRSVNQVDLEFLPKGLHDKDSARMRDRLQQSVDRAEGGPYEAVLLGYALCGNGVAGLRPCESLIADANWNGIYPQRYA